MPVTCPSCGVTWLKGDCTTTLERRSRCSFEQLVRAASAEDAPEATESTEATSSELHQEEAKQEQLEFDFS